MTPSRPFDAPAPRKCVAMVKAALLALTVSALATLVATQAGADDRWKQSSSAWKTADNCARAAIRAFPDYTQAALAKREAFRRECLRKANLPAGDDPAPAPR